MKKGSRFSRLELLTSAPVESAIYYEWLLKLSPEEKPGDALSKIGVDSIRQPEPQYEQAPGWIPVFLVEEISQAISRVEALAVTVKKIAVEGSTRTYVINSAGVWTGIRQSDDTKSSTEVFVDQSANCDYSAVNLDIATTLLTTLLDSEYFSVSDDPFSMRILFKENNPVAGVFLLQGVEGFATHPNWLIYFETDDVAAMVSRAAESGSRILIPPTLSPFNTYSVLKDPWGNLFGISTVLSVPSDDQILVNVSGNKKLLHDVLAPRST